MRRSIIFISILVVFLLSIFIFQNIYFPSFKLSNFFGKEEEVIFGIKEFNKESLRKEKYSIFCGKELENGNLLGEDYFSICKECIDYCPIVSFHFSIYDNIIFSDINKDGNNEAILILSKKIGEEAPNLFLVLMNSSFIEYPAVNLGKGLIIDYITVDDGIINISLLSHNEEDSICCPTKKEIRRYSLVGDYLRELTELERIKYRSVEQGFQFEYPKEWEIEKVNDTSLTIYQSLSSSYNFPILIDFSEKKTSIDYSNFLFYDIENIRISTNSKTPYKDIFEEIINSFKINKEKVFNDYTFFRKELLNEDFFVEIDAEDMKIYLYENGKKEKEFNILAKGDYEKWGGSPAGLYNVISKDISAFSNISNVYMPYAVRIYGSYLIHGEPYYLGGGKIISQFSSGCFRVKNEDMKNIFQDLKIEEPILVIDRKNDKFEYKDRKIIPFPEISADKYLIADINSGFIIAERNMNKDYKIDSITKLMTSLIMVENTDINKKITARSYMLLGKDYYPKFFAGSSFKISDLFVPTLLGDIDNSTWLLSHYFGIEETLKKMNEKTKPIMMNNTFFVDPVGDDEGNISTAKDLFYLIRYIKNNNLPLLNISKGINVSSVNQYLFSDIKNENIFYDNPNFIGGKKGSEISGIYVFNIWGRDIAFIILGAEDENQIKKEIEDNIEWIKNSIKY